MVPSSRPVRSGVRPAATRSHRASTRAGARVATRFTFAALALLGTAGCSGLMPQGGSEGKEDDAARLAHFEEAAQTYYDGGKFDQSARQWRKVLEIEPERPKANWGLAKSLAMVGTPQSLREAEGIFTKIDEWDWMHPTLGDRRHEVLKDHAEVYLQLADFYDRDVRALEQQLDDPGADVPSIRRHMQEQLARRNSLLAQAIPIYERVMTLSPNNPYAIAGLAKAHLLVGQDQRGIAFARQYMALSKDSQTGWESEYNSLVSERGRDATEEQRDFYKSKIRAAREKELKMHLLLASVLMRNHDYRGAVAEYDKVLEMDPTRPAARVERAQARAGMGDYGRAVEDLEEYLQVTDPVKQRNPRLRAADLLEQYRLKAAAMSASSTPSSGPRPGTTYPPPPPAPTRYPAPPPPPAPYPTPYPQTAPRNVPAGR